MLHRLLISFCVQKIILIYVHVRLHYTVTTHSEYVVWVLSQYCVAIVLFLITACWHLLLLIRFYPSFCCRKLYVNRIKLILNVVINTQSTTAGWKMTLKGKYQWLLSPNLDMEMDVSFTLRNAMISGNVHLKYRKGEFWWKDNIKMNFEQYFGRAGLEQSGSGTCPVACNGITRLKPSVSLITTSAIN
jgi:hypothetical protein